MQNKDNVDQRLSQNNDFDMEDTEQINTQIPQVNQNPSSQEGSSSNSDASMQSQGSGSNAKLQQDLQEASQTNGKLQKKIKNMELEMIWREQQFQQEFQKREQQIQQEFQQEFQKREQEFKLREQEMEQQIVQLRMMHYQKQ